MRGPIAGLWVVVLLAAAAAATAAEPAWTTYHCDAQRTIVLPGISTRNIDALLTGPH